MKVIFSRKGFDSAAGGCPSPIVDGRPLSLPIPAGWMPTPTTYAMLPAPCPVLVADLTRGRYSPGDGCHLDPDINPASLPRLAGWRGTLGQAGAAQAHLAGQGIGPGDLFLFWGLFRAAVPVDGRWRFTGPREHRIWGWLHVGEVIDLGPDGSHAVRQHPWLRDHPHARPGWQARNTLYIASDAGASGTLAHGFRLSAETRRPSRWHLPDWLNPMRGGTGLTCMKPERWEASGLVQTPPRGQEFVADAGDRADAAAWITAVLRDSAKE